MAYFHFVGCFFYGMLIYNCLEEAMYSNIWEMFLSIS